MNYLATKAANLQMFVVKKLVMIVAKVTKLGWFEEQAFREIVQEAKQFLSASSRHCEIGLLMLQTLVQHINTNKVCQSRGVCIHIAA